MRATTYDMNGEKTYQYFDKGNTLFIKYLDTGEWQLEFDNLLSKLFSTEELIELKEELTEYITLAIPWKLPDITSPLYVTSTTGEEYLCVMRGKSDVYELQVNLGTKQGVLSKEQIKLSTENFQSLYYYIIQIIDEFITNELN